MGNKNSKQLVKAAGDGDIKQVEESISKGVNIDSVDNIGRTALSLASTYGHDKIVDLLIKNKANINHAHNYDSTALIKASINGQY
jgi:ankyrin repeat protein